MAFSKDCFRPNSQSDYYWKALSPLTSLAAKDFSNNEGNIIFQPYFELICEASDCNKYVVSVTGKTNNSTWFYGYRVDLMQNESVSLTQFIKSKEIHKVYDELNLKLANDTANISNSTIHNDNKTKFISIQSFINAQVTDEDINGQIDENTNKNTSSLLSRRKNDWFGRKTPKNSKPIVTKPKTSFRLGHRKRHVAEEQDSDEDQTEDSPLMIDEDKQPNFEKSDEDVNRFDRLVASVGEKRANNWRSVSKEKGKEISILAALSQSKQTVTKEVKSALLAPSK